MKAFPFLTGENTNDSLPTGSGYSLVTGVLNNEYNNTSFLGDGKEEVRNSMAIHTFRTDIWNYWTPDFRISSVVFYLDRAPW